MVNPKYDAYRIDSRAWGYYQARWNITQSVDTDWREDKEKGTGMWVLNTTGKVFVDASSWGKGAFRRMIVTALDPKQQEGDGITSKGAVNKKGEPCEDCKIQCKTYDVQITFSKPGRGKIVINPPNPKIEKDPGHPNDKEGQGVGPFGIEVQWPPYEINLAEGQGWVVVEWKVCAGPEPRGEYRRIDDKFDGEHGPYRGWNSLMDADKGAHNPNPVPSVSVE